jgi:EAL domain-containing protein (putative c-di-GMP-specific phosphodiesterase class I)
MIRFFGQAKYDVKTQQLVGYEFFIRVRQQQQWRLPEDFSVFKAQQVTDLLAATLKTLPQTLTLISFNLDQAQFIDPEFCQRLVAVQAQTPIHIYVELTERSGEPQQFVTVQQLVQAVKRYHDAGLHVCLDDVGSGENTIQLVNALSTNTDEYKFALQNFRDDYAWPEVLAKLKSWSQLAQQQHKVFAIEGFEAADELRLADVYHAQLAQGYYLGRPQLLSLPQDQF